MLTAAALLFFVYLGFEDDRQSDGGSSSSGPRLSGAIFVSLGFTTLLYVMVSLAVVALADASGAGRK